MAYNQRNRSLVTGFTVTDIPMNQSDDGISPAWRAIDSFERVIGLMNSKHLRVLVVAAVFLSGVFLAAPPANALSFTPSESEWVVWPDYCRARYVVSGAGKSSVFKSRVSPAVVAQHKARVGAEAWYWLHHYCAARAYITRAANEESDTKTEQWLREAESNAMGQYERIGNMDTLFIDVTISIAQIHIQRGNNDAALRFLNQAIHAQPTVSSPYALASMIYRKTGEPRKAVQVLQKGDTALDGQSAEIHYFLGHIYIELSELDSAADHARRAYELGYPLPGLASKLRRLGRTL